MILIPEVAYHFVDSDNELLDTEGVGKESMLTSLTIFGNTSLKLTSTSGNDEDSTISLGSTGNHVLDEVTMARGIWKRFSKWRKDRQVMIYQ